MLISGDRHNKSPLHSRQQTLGTVTHTHSSLIVSSSLLIIVSRWLWSAPVQSALNGSR